MLFLTSSLTVLQILPQSINGPGVVSLVTDCLLLLPKPSTSLHKSSTSYFSLKDRILSNSSLPALIPPFSPASVLINNYSYELSCAGDPIFTRYHGSFDRNTTHNSCSFLRYLTTSSLILLFNPHHKHSLEPYHL